MVVSCYLRNYKPNGKLFPIHPPFISHLSSLMVWLWLLVHSTLMGSRYSDPSRYKGRALWWWHFMGVVVHVKVFVCCFSKRTWFKWGNKHSYNNTLWDQFKFVIKLHVQSIRSPAPFTLWWETLTMKCWKPSKHNAKRLSHGNPEIVFMCGHGLSNVM